MIYNIVEAEDSNINEIPLVSILCQTFNHEKYIRQCLEGFMMQKTNFLFDVLIHDDASTDGTVSIIKEFENKFPSIIKPIYQVENQFSKGNKVFTGIQLVRVKAKYISICEGDDYWTDPLKLQKQVRFLEKNTEYGLIYTKVRRYIQSDKKIERRSWGKKANFETLVNRNTIPTLTTVFRTEICNQFLDEFRNRRKEWKMGDYPLWLYFSLKSKIYFMNETTGVYRVLSESLSHSPNLEKREAFLKSFYDIGSFFMLYANVVSDKKGRAECLLQCLVTNAMVMNNRKLALEYCAQIENKTIKLKLKEMLCKSNFLFYLFSKFNTLRF